MVRESEFSIKFTHVGGIGFLGGCAMPWWKSVLLVIHQSHWRQFCVILCCRFCFWAPSCSWPWTVPGPSWMGFGWHLVRPTTCWISFIVVTFKVSPHWTVVTASESFYDDVLLLQQMTRPFLSPPSLRPVVLDTVFEWHAVVEEPGGGATNRGAGVQGLHAAHVGAVCWSLHSHLHLSPLLRSGWVLSQS